MKTLQRKHKEKTMYQSLEKQQLTSFGKNDYGRATKHAAVSYERRGNDKWGKISGLDGGMVL